jgi:hypothetical protein
LLVQGTDIAQLGHSVHFDTGGQEDFMTRRILVLALGILAISLGSAEAAPLTWNLNNVLFNDGTTVTGSFVFDDDTDSFSALNITTSGGSSVPAQSTWFYDTLCTGCQQNNSGISGFLAVDAGPFTGAHFVSLFSSSGPLMTNAGGVVTLDFGVIGTCLAADCGTFTIALPNSFLTSGAFVSQPAAAAVPEPATLLLVGSGVSAAVAARRRKRESAGGACTSRSRLT